MLHEFFTFENFYAKSTIQHSRFLIKESYLQWSIENEGWLISYAIVFSEFMDFSIIPIPQLLFFVSIWEIFPDIGEIKMSTSPLIMNDE